MCGCILRSREYIVRERAKDRLYRFVEYEAWTGVTNLVRHNIGIRVWDSVVDPVLERTFEEVNR